MTMKIAVISRSWPVHERSGVTLAAAQHVRILAAAGHEVVIIGADAAVLKETLPVVERLHVAARGSGALYSPARVDKAELSGALRRLGVGLVLTESWQTALTDVAVDVARDLGLPVLMVSHGVSLHPFTPRLRDRLRAWLWGYYRRVTLPARVRRLTALTALDSGSTSLRFHDRDVARRCGVPVLPLVNAPVHRCDYVRPRGDRRRQVIVVGYYSAVKNQLDALRVMADLPADIQFCFVGPRRGRYYERCVRAAEAWGLRDRVQFLEDHECNLAEEIAASLVLLAPSSTEALPLTLLEAMASGTPFVATPVGAVPQLRAGHLAVDRTAQRDAILRLLEDEVLWQVCSQAGQREYRNRYTDEHVRGQLLDAVARTVALRRRPG